MESCQLSPLKRCNAPGEVLQANTSLCTKISLRSCWCEILPKSAFLNMHKVLNVKSYQPSSLNGKILYIGYIDKVIAIWDLLTCSTCLSSQHGKVLFGRQRTKVFGGKLTKWRKDGDFILIKEGFFVASPVYTLRSLYNLEQDRWEALTAWFFLLRGLR